MQILASAPRSLAAVSLGVSLRSHNVISALGAARQLSTLPAAIRPSLCGALVASTTAATQQRVQKIPAVFARGLKQNSAGTKDKNWVEKGDVTYAELKPETEAPSGKITLIDVREPEEVAQGMIPSAVNVPLSSFATAFDTSKESDFQRKYAFPRPAYDDPIIVYCRSGKRSSEALAHANKMGWWNVRNYRGSWLDWVQHEKEAIDK